MFHEVRPVGTGLFDADGQTDIPTDGQTNMMIVEE